MRLKRTGILTKVVIVVLLVYLATSLLDLRGQIQNTKEQQQTVSLSKKQVEELVVTGRHDPCIVPRAVPVVEAVTALVLTDLLFSREK